MPYFLISISSLLAGAAAGYRLAPALLAQVPAGPYNEIISALLGSGSIGLLAATMFYIWYKQGKDNDKREERNEKRSDKAFAGMREEYNRIIDQLRKDNHEERTAAVLINRDRYETALKKVDEVMRLQGVIIAKMEVIGRGLRIDDTALVQARDTVEERTPGG